MSLSTMALSTRLQFNKTDEHNNATDLAEMGVTYYQTEVNSLIPQATSNAQKNSTNFCTELTNLSNQKLSSQTSIKSVDGTNSYQIIAPSITCTDPTKVTLTFSSKGITANDSVTLKGTFTISGSSGSSRVGQTLPSTSSFSTQAGDVSINGNRNFLCSTSTYFKSFTSNGKVKLTVNSDAYFGSLTMNGNSSVLVKGNAYFNYLIMNGTPGYIEVDGDAIFINPPIKQNTSICIKGNIYKVDSATHMLVNYTNYTNYFTNICSSSITTWQLNPDSGINVQY
ncbi:MAG: hypothetical protein Q8934_07990 [Bacillota bacterium]|nr:hypothetical protein [Bacillota bacterium]